MYITFSSLQPIIVIPVIKHDMELARNANTVNYKWVVIYTDHFGYHVQFFSFAW